ncbi:MAG: hypothetical protein ACK5KM_05150 [Hyphomicrobiaceae bacterium]
MGLKRKPPVFEDASQALFSDTDKVVWNLPVTKCVSYYYYRFGENGWSPFEEAARQSISGISHSEIVERLQLYYHDFQPRNLGEACFGIEHGLAELDSISPYTRFKPWRRTTALISGANGEGNQNFGPTTLSKTTMEVERSVGVTRSVMKHGYQPDAFRDGYIHGYALISGADFRFLITGGVHRLAALSALGHDRVLVKFDKKMPRFIDKESVLFWPQVASGDCSKATALAMFDAYFLNQPDFRQPLFPVGAS